MNKSVGKSKGIRIYFPALALAVLVLITLACRTTAKSPTEAVPTEAASIGAPTPSPEYIVPEAPTAPPPPDDVPMARLFYQDVFETGPGGFRPEWSVDALETSSYSTEYGELVTEDYVAAYIGDMSWTNYSVKFGGADYSQIEQFTVLIRTQDEMNYIGVDCFLSDGWLACEGYRFVNGQEEGVPGFEQAVRLCAVGQIRCDIEIEAQGDEYRVLVNDDQQVVFNDSTLSQGGTGFVVNGQWVLGYFEAISLPSPASPGYTLFRDDFETNAWGTGTIDDEYVASNQEIVNGKYRWEMEAKQGLVLKEIHEIPVPFDPDSFPYRFSLTADVRRVSGAEDSAYGLLFRCVNHDNLYYFSVEDSGHAALYALENGGWVELVGQTPTSAPQPGQTNRLTVTADGSRFSFHINGQYIFQANDDRFQTGGGIGLAVELYGAGDEGVFEFDNVELFVP